MKKRFTNRRNSRKKRVAFKPGRNFIRWAVEDYLAAGGIITKIEFDENSYREFISFSESPISVDEFLQG